jgi:hypothetical protein
MDSLDEIFTCGFCERKFATLIKMTKDDSLHNYFSKLICPECIVRKINPFETNEYKLLEITLAPQRVNKTEFTNSNFSLDMDLINLLKQDTKLGIYLYLLESTKVISSLNKYRWPPSLSIIVNGVKLFLDNKLFIDCTYVIKCQNNISLIHNYLSNQITCLIFITRSKSMSEMQIGKIMTYREGQKKTIQDLTNQMICKEKFLLTCVYNGKLIELPVKGNNCRHFQCFDYSSFIKINKLKKKFECPMCKQLCFFDDLYEDKFFKAVLEDCLTYQSNYEDYEFFLDNQGRLTIEKIKKEDSQDVYVFDKKTQGKIENMNHSNESSMMDIEIEIENDGILDPLVCFFNLAVYF